MLPAPQVKRIAERAGRSAMNSHDANVMTFPYGYSGYLMAALTKPTTYLTRIGIMPEADPMKLLAYRFPEDSMAQLLIKYTALAALDSRYFLCFNREQLQLSDMLASLPLTIEDRHIFMMAPITADIAQFAFKVPLFGAC